jgi:hypothetical protein
MNARVTQALGQCLTWNFFERFFAFAITTNHPTIQPTPSIILSLSFSQSALRRKEQKVKKKKNYYQPGTHNNENE